MLQITTNKNRKKIKLKSNRRSKRHNCYVKNMAKKIIAILIIITWPISLFLNNTPKDFLSYIFPFFNPKFAIFPLIFVLIYFRFKKPILILVSILILIIFFKPFYGQTIFIKDYEAGQKVLQQEKLYPSIFM